MECYYMVGLKSGLMIVVAESNIVEYHTRLRTIKFQDPQTFRYRDGTFICRGNDFNVLNDIAGQRNLGTFKVVLQPLHINKDIITPPEQNLRVPHTPPKLKHDRKFRNYAGMKSNDSTPLSHYSGSRNLKGRRLFTEPEFDSNLEIVSSPWPVVVRRLSFSKSSTSSCLDCADEKDNELTTFSEDDDDSVADRDYQPQADDLALYENDSVDESDGGLSGINILSSYSKKLSQSTHKPTTISCSEAGEGVSYHVSGNDYTSDESEILIQQPTSRCFRDDEGRNNNPVSNMLSPSLSVAACEGSKEFSLSNNSAINSTNITDADSILSATFADSTEGIECSSSEATSKKNRKYQTKYNCCTYCKKINSKIVRHFINIHSDEEEVKRFMLLPKNNIERTRIITKLRLAGNFEYNANNSENSILGARKLHTKVMDRNNYTPCPNCHVFITKMALRRHFKMCNPGGTYYNDRSLLRNSRAMLSDVHPEANELLKSRIFPVLKEDAVKNIIRHDRLIILYGNVMCQKYRDEHHFDMIRNRLRSIGKFLSLLKQKNESIDDFASVMKPKYFNTIAICLHEIGDYNPILQHYKKPTLPTTLATAIKYITDLYISDCIKRSDWVKKKEAKNLQLLLKTELRSTINKTSTESLLQHKRQKPVVLPTTDDIKKLNVYVLQNRNRHYNEIDAKGFSYNSWLELSKYTLISILIFNRRRPGELERTLVSDLDSLQSIDKTNELFQQLSSQAKKAIYEYKRFTIRGKLARGVPVLLHEQMRKCIDILLKYRNVAGIHKNNGYLFALPQPKNESNPSFRHLRASVLMRLFSAKCGISNPEVLRATQLRKHVATKSVSLNLDNAEVSTLQNFLGHADRVHKDYYRQPVLMDDITKMSRLLEIAQGTNDEEKDESYGRMEKYQEQSPVHGRTDTIEEEGNGYVNVEEPAETNLEEANADEPTETIEEEVNVIVREPGESNFEEANADEPMEIIEGGENGNVGVGPGETNLDNGNAHGRMETIVEEESERVETVQPGQANGKKNGAMKKRKRLLDIDLGYIHRKTWSTPEKHTARDVFKTYLETNTLPSYKICSQLIRLNKCLQNRSPPQVISWLKNQITKKQSNKPFLKKGWTTPERKTVREVFKHYISGQHEYKYPSTADIMEVLVQHPELQDRTPRKIRSQIQHQRKLYDKKQYILSK